ncbi:MAG: outer membrane beta-barrel protein [Deltaproteobacteria bacterium]|nr:outer membrane beta-barrel protein [Deltaproteobacteria bacterium]
MSPMRTLVGVAVVFAGLAVARPAHAQFQNHSIGLEVGYIHLQNDIGFGDAILPPALALDATLYIENGFDVGLRFGFAIQQDKESTSQIIMLYPAAFFRYYLSQDYFRPWVGLSLEYMHSFDSDGVTAGTVASDNYVGLGPMVGFDYFINPDWSVGLTGEFVGYYALNAGAHYSIQAWARVATHF